MTILGVDVKVEAIEAARLFLTLFAGVVVLFVVVIAAITVGTLLFWVATGYTTWLGHALHIHTAHVQETCT